MTNTDGGTKKSATSNRDKPSYISFFRMIKSSLHIFPDVCSLGGDEPNLFLARHRAAQITLTEFTVVME